MDCVKEPSEILQPWVQPVLEAIGEMDNVAHGSGATGDGTGTESRS